MKIIEFLFSLSLLIFKTFRINTFINLHKCIYRQKDSAIKSLKSFEKEGKYWLFSSHNCEPENKRKLLKQNYCEGICKLWLKIKNGKKLIW